MVKHSAHHSWSLLHWFGTMALWIDERLRRRDHVYEFSNDPRCVYRMQLAVARQDVVFADGVAVRCGDMIINLHVWNEQIPAMPPEGPTFAWGRRLGMAMDLSLRQLAEYMARHPEFDEVMAIRANMAVATARTTKPLLRIMQHLGFEIVPCEGAVSWRQRLHQCGENILGLLLLMAVNPEAARISVLSRIRSQMLSSRQAFDRRYGVVDRANRNLARQVSGETLSATSSAARQSPAAQISAA